MLVGANAAASSQASRRQAQFQNRQYQSVATAALRDQISQNDQLAIRFSEERSAASQQSEASRLQAQAGRATAAVSAAARGVSGVSVAELLDDYDRIESGNEFIINENLGFISRQLGVEAEGVAAQAQSRISSAAPFTPDSVNPLALALQLGAVSLDGLAQIAEEEGWSNLELDLDSSGGE